MMDWINSEQGITVLRTLFLLILLVWLLTNGFSFLSRRSGDDEARKRSGRKNENRKDDE